MALHRTGLVLASLALLFGAAACGGGSGDDPAPANGGGPGGEGMNAYFECLQKNGVTVAMPSGGARASRGPRPSGEPRPSGQPRQGGGGFMGGKPEGVDDATWEKAQAACASVRPSFGPGGGNGRGDGGGMSPAYRNCLQENGVTMGQGSPAPDDGALRKAREACKALAPAPRPSS
ncbi:hypothetical protein [Actinoplanes sp. NBRC 103695]|uniref:hypothetical protein n=1 Tax=Actinoplanes sp. NBRC 103695 TaxID=3032202 RepID=UPI0024A20159|nr:hypothetical protein [Actinoplanes sp. NBRC 103695]GLZ01926.1 hypothetical protein Acsp02_91770 [Actinoplanes sp. NBRC 103695]